MCNNKTLKPYCILLTGMPNSGKTTIAYELVQKRLRNVLIIDGDKHREMQFLGKKLGFGKEDITKNTEHVIKMAQFAQEQGINVLISQIAPYREQRELMRGHLEGFIEVLCDCSTKERAKRPNFVETEIEYEYGTPNLIVKTSMQSASECADNVLAILNKPECSFFIGRFQPPHPAHVALLRSVLDEGKNVAVGLKDTPPSKANPYTIEEREKMFQDIFADEIQSGRMEILRVPNVGEVCWGRNVGWGRREIRLSSELEKISGTGIRNDTAGKA